LRRRCGPLRGAGIAGEVILADNGSTDGSQALAEAEGARVVPVTAKGYGNALMGGIEAARGKFVLMGDADDSYDFLEIPKFVAKLREGFDLVQGCRLPWGWGHGGARGHAVVASVDRQPDVLPPGPPLVPGADP
jgi:glycosyltransferase involved in cell wall biosynthesis